MRRIITLSTLLMAGLAVFSCRTDEMETPNPEAPLAGEKIVLHLSTAETKTANEGLKTSWVEGDAVAVFHALAGTTNYVNDGKFTITSPDTGLAVGTAGASLETGKSYDWFIIYPYADGLTSPAAQNKTVVLGAADGRAQIQNGNNSRAHIAGEAYPLWGIATGVLAGEEPQIRVRNLSSLLAVKITNGSPNTITLKNIAFTAPEDIIGEYFVDVTGEAPVFTKAADVVFNTARTNIKDGASLGAGASATVYMVIKPFTAPAGSKLKLDVVAITNQNVTLSWNSTITLDQDKQFKPGFITDVTASFDKEPTVLHKFKKVSSVTLHKKYVFVYGDEMMMRAPKEECTESMTADAIPVEPVGDLLYLENTDDAITLDGKGATSGGYSIKMPVEETELFLGNKGYSSTTSHPDKPLMTITSTKRFWQFELLADGTISIYRNATFSELTKPYYILYKDGNATFSVYDTNESAAGTSFFLYEYEGESEVIPADQVSSQSGYGIYGVSGVTYTEAQGQTQVSIRRRGSKINFRIINPIDNYYYEITGIPRQVEEGDYLTIEATLYVKRIAEKTYTAGATVKKVEDGKIWLICDDGSGFIVSNK